MPTFVPPSPPPSEKLSRGPQPWRPLSVLLPDEVERLIAHAETRSDDAQDRRRLRLASRRRDGEVFRADFADLIEESRGTAGCYEIFSSLLPILEAQPEPVIVRIYESGHLQMPHLDPGPLHLLQSAMVPFPFWKKSVQKASSQHLGGARHVPVIDGQGGKEPDLARCIKTVPAVGRACVLGAEYSHRLLRESMRRDRLSLLMQQEWPLDSIGERLLRSMPPVWTTEAPVSFPLDTERLSSLVWTWLGRATGEYTLESPSPGGWGSSLAEDLQRPNGWSTLAETWSPRIGAIVQQMQSGVVLVRDLQQRLLGRVDFSRFIGSHGNTIDISAPPDSPLALARAAAPRGTPDLDILLHLLKQRQQSWDTPGAVDALCAPSPIGANPITGRQSVPSRGRLSSL